MGEFGSRFARPNSPCVLWCSGFSILSRVKFLFEAKISEIFVLKGFGGSLYW